MTNRYEYCVVVVYHPMRMCIIPVADTVSLRPESLEMLQQYQKYFLF